MNINDYNGSDKYINDIINGSDNEGNDKFGSDNNINDINGSDNNGNDIQVI